MVCFVIWHWESCLKKVSNSVFHYRCSPLTIPHNSMLIISFIRRDPVCPFVLSSGSLSRNRKVLPLARPVTLVLWGTKGLYTSIGAETWLCLLTPLWRLWWLVLINIFTQSRITWEKASLRDYVAQFNLWACLWQLSCLCVKTLLLIGSVVSGLRVLSCLRMEK